MALGYSQIGIWSVCCVAGGGDGQAISDEGTVTEEKSFCMHSWAHMSVDYALSNSNNFIAHICMKN